MSRALSISALNTVEVGATTDQTKADLNAIGVSGGRKNLIINGGMNVAQRGTTMSNSTTSTSYHTLDRWQTHGSGGTYNLSQQTMTAGTSNQTGGRSNFARFSVITGDNNLSLRQCIEDVTIIPEGSNVTVSFYAKGTAGKVLNVFMQSLFGAGGSGSVSHSVTESDFTLTTSWVKYNISFTMPSDFLTGKTIGVGSFNRLQFRQPSSDTSTTAYTLDITGVQLELGSVATDFEHRSYGEELALCQRYYQARSLHDYIAFHYSTYAYSVIPLGIEMRAAPTVTTVGQGTSYYEAGATRNFSVSGVGSSTSRVNIVGNVTGGTQGYSGTFYPVYQASAEL